MKAALLTAPERIEIGEVESPVLAGSQVMIQPLRAGTTTIHVRTDVSQVDATATITVQD